jgi:hypothetical protein
MDYTSQIILRLQKQHQKAVEQYAHLLNTQFERRVDATILRILFREESSSLEELELAMYEQEVVYTELRTLDAQIIWLRNEIEQIDLALDTL